MTIKGLLARALTIAIVLAIRTFAFGLVVGVKLGTDWLAMLVRSVTMRTATTHALDHL
jgi:hypothetical protein